MQLKTANAKLAVFKPGVTIEKANYGRGDRYALRRDGHDIGRFYTVEEAYQDAHGLSLKPKTAFASDGSPRVLDSATKGRQEWREENV